MGEGELTTLMDVDPTSPVVLGIAGAAGLVLVLFGGKLARPVISFGGLLIGGAVVYLMPKQTMDSTMHLLWIAGGCLVGVVLAWVLFRIMMGVSFAALLLALLPTVALLVQGQAPHFEAPDPDELLIEVAPPDDADADADDDSDAKWDRRAREIVDRLIGVQVKTTQQWWEQLDRTGQYSVTFCAGAGLLIGLIIGLIGPYFTASVLLAFIGSVMLYASAVLADLPQLNTHLPDAPLGQLAVVGLITAVGVSIQWTVLRRKADKS